MNSGAEELMSTLKDRGFKPHPTDLSEFLKAGGAAKCLSLLLDHAS
jgi:N-dimethylarginine dimethylaminohydrolase